MSQNDLVISNQSFPATRADINSALQALGSMNSGPTAPATTYANMQWYDTANNILKMRSEADDAWINIGTLDQSTNTFTPAGVAELSQAQAEDDASTVFGQVSGQRLAQAVAANAAPQVEQKSIPTTTWTQVYDPRTGPTTFSSANIILPAGFYLVTLNISMEFAGAGSEGGYTTSYEMRHIKGGSTTVLQSGSLVVTNVTQTRSYTITEGIFEFGGDDYFTTFEPDTSDLDDDRTTVTITLNAKGPYANASYLA